MVAARDLAESGRVMLISGTSRGIGRTLAGYYSRGGFEVVGCSRRSVDLGLPRYRHFALDVSDERAVREMFFAIRKTYGRLDVLLNNAAINPAVAPVLLTPISSVEKTFRVNFLGTYLLSREAAKLMSRNRFGRIVNFSSMAAYHRVPGEAAYSASKAAVEAFTSVFAKEVYRQGITCNAIAPSAVPTELSAAVDKNALSDVLKRNAIPVFGTTDDVAAAVDCLIDDRSSAVTGQTIYLGGV